MKVMRFERQPDKVNLCIIVDVYNWAWDIANKEMLNATKRINGIIYSCDDFVRQRPDMKLFDLVLFYPWGNSRVKNRLAEDCPEKVIIGVAGGDQITEDRLKAFDIHCSMFNMIGANNEIIQKIFKRRYPDKEVFILSHGTDTEMFKPKKKTSKKFTIGWVGNHSRELKRFSLAQEIVWGLDGVEFKTATYEDKIPHKDMPKFYNSIDVLLVTSDREAHPMIVYEAMASGIPVVTTDVGDVADTIINDENGYILPINAEPEKYQTIISALKRSKKLRDKIGTNARDTILNRWTWDKVVRQYNEYLAVPQ